MRWNHFYNYTELQYGDDAAYTRCSPFNSSQFVNRTNQPITIATSPSTTRVLYSLPKRQCSWYLHPGNGKISAANELQKLLHITGTGHRAAGGLRHFIYWEIREHFNVIWTKAKFACEARVAFGSQIFWIFTS